MDVFQSFLDLCDSSTLTRSQTLSCVLWLVFAFGFFLIWFFAC